MAFTKKRIRKDGSTAYSANWTDADTQKEKSITYHSEAEADQTVRFLNANGQSFTLANKAISKMRSSTPTLNQIIDLHIKSLTGIESGTRARYRRLHENHIRERLGGIPVDRIDRADVLDWFDEMEGSAKSKKNIHSLLSAALTTAVHEKHIDSNPAKGIRAPKTSLKTRDAVFLTKDEFELLATTIDTRFELFIRTLAGSGIRFSEATELRRKDVRLDGSRVTLRVHRSWKRGESGMEVSGPKTRGSVRPVSLSTNLSKMIITHIDDLDSNDLLFTSAGSSPLRNNRFHDLYWDPVVEKLTAGDAPKGKRLHAKPVPHDLRHSHASWLLAAGVPIHVVQARLGHASIKTTVDVYGWLVRGADAAAADVLDD